MTKARSRVMAGLGALLAALALAVVAAGQPLAPAGSAPAGAPALRYAPAALGMLPTPRYTLTLPSLMRFYNPAYAPPFGVIMYGNVDDASGLQAMKLAGAKTATTVLNWAAIQPTLAGPLDWSSFDAKAQNAQTAGLDLFVLFTGNPSWAAQYPGGPLYDGNMPALVNFVTAMAQRYNCDGVDDAPGHPCVRNWSFYAEPDNSDPNRALGGKGYWGKNGAGYAALLAQISPAIHAVDPKAKVLIGGLAYDWFITDGGPFVQSFLGDVLSSLNYQYSGGAARYLDAVAFHYYPISATRWSTIREKAQEIRGIMAANGAGSLPLLSPEMGYWSSPNFGSSEQRQADWLAQTYARGLSVDVRLLSWYKVSDDVVAGTPADVALDQTAGLLRLDGTPKPSYYAYQTVAHELAGAQYAGPYQAPGVEGYVFNMDANLQKTVLWATSGTVHVVFPYAHLRVVTATGTQYDILDNQHPAGAPGDLDGGVPGQIQLQVDPGAPIYVERK